MSSAVEHSDPVEFLSSILAAVPWFVTRVDTDYRIRYINRVQPPLQLSDVIGTNVFDFVTPDYHEIALACFDQVLKSGEASSYESHASGANGETAVYVNYVTPILKGGEATGLCIVGVDLSEERHRERALSEKKRELELAVAATHLGLWHFDATTGEVVWNERMKEICGVSEAMPLPRFVAEIVHPEDRAIVMSSGEKMMQSTEVVQDSSRLVVNGEIRWVLNSGQAFFNDDGSFGGMTGGLLDITKQRKTEEQLARAQKMEAIGQLTAGVAHNFNNMLMVLQPTLEMLARDAAGESKELLADALAVSKRAADMVRKLMDLAGRRSTPRHQPVALDRLAEDAVRICERTFERHVRLELEARDRFVVDGDGGELTQVLMNLLLNARDALIAADAPEPRISLAIKSAAADIDVPAGAEGPHGFVSICVRDNGPGIPTHIRERIFEPFFTTKGSVGTGMGLATCSAIVERHKGWMTCTSQLGHGAELCALLPLASKDTVIALDSAPSATRATKARVLLIDDEAAIRATLAKAFDREGVEAEMASSAAAAVELLERDNRFDVVLLDRSMPGIPGGQLVATLRERIPETKIIFFTGESVPDHELEQVDALVTKPLSIPKLVDAIRQVLGE